MQAIIQKWGNSQGIRINKEILEQSNLSIGERVKITARKGQVIIKSAPRPEKKYKLEELLERIPKDYKAEEEDFGKPEGKETW